MKPKEEIRLGGVDEYITAQPDEVRPALNAMRAAIRKAAEGCSETLSYFQMPGFFYEGYAYNGMFAWFSYKAPSIRLHVLPPVIDEHSKELSGFKTTKAIVSFPEKAEIPVELVIKLVKASINAMKKGKN